MLLLVVVGEVTLEGAEASWMKEKKKRTYRIASHRCSPRWLDHLCYAAADTGGGRGDHRRCSPRPPWDLGEGAMAAAALGEAAATAALGEEAPTLFLLLLFFCTYSFNALSARGAMLLLHWAKV